MGGQAENSSRNSSMEDLNDEKVKANIGVIVFLSILMIFGLFGNSNTIFIYWKKIKPSNYRTFILCLAMADLATCCLSMPVALIVLRYPLMFPYNEICKGFYFVTYSMCIGSTLILVTIAADRYRKICVPHGAQLSIRMAKYICILDLLLASAFSWPCIVLFGNKRNKTPGNNEDGIGCYYSDDVWNTSYPATYNYVLIFILSVTFVALLVIYALISKQILHIHRTRQPKTQIQSRKRKDTEKSDTNQNSSTTETQENVAAKHHVSEKTEISGCVFSSPDDVANIAERQTGCKPDQILKSQKEDDGQTLSKLERRRSKTIIQILLIMTVVSFISFLPNLILSIISLEHVDFLPNLSFTEMFTYQIFSWSFYINNVAFPIIYGFCDQKFMKETRKLYSLCVPACFRRR